MATGYLQRLQDESRKFTQNLSLTQKVVLGSMVILTVVALIFVTIWAQQPQWTTLYADLNAKDAGNIVEYLKSNNTPYQLKTVNGQTVIEVPSQRVHDLRLEMAAQDLPKEGGVMGFELFDKDQVGVTNNLFDVNYQRALSGELARTIMQLEPVERARVHLAIPKKQIFSELADPATASVTVRLRPGSELSENQVKGISKLVAGSVPALAFENVTVTDTLGNILFDQDMAGLSGAGQLTRLNTEQLKLQRTIETQIRRDVHDILGKVVGPENVDVKVKANLDFDKEEQESTSFTPNANTESPAENVKVLRSEKTTTENGEGQSGPASGVPGVATNTTSFQQNDQEGNTSYNRTEDVKNYEVPEVKTRIVKSQGTIKRLSLSVAINSQSPVLRNLDNTLGGEAQMLERLRKLAITAAGIDPARGDNVAVQTLAFDTSDLQAQAQAMAEAERREFLMRMIYGIAMVLGLLLLFVILYLAFFRRQEPEIEEVELSEEDSLLLALNEAPEYQELSQAALRRASTVNSLAQIAHEDPERMARLLRTWISEN